MLSRMIFKMSKLFFFYILFKFLFFICDWLEYLIFIFCYIFLGIMGWLVGLKYNLLFLVLVINMELVEIKFGCVNVLNL